MVKINTTACFIFWACLPAAIFAQTRWEAGISGASTNYYGDFSPENVVSTETHLGYGGFVRYNLHPNWGFRLNYLNGTISGHDHNFPAASPERKRDFSFKNNVREISATIDFEPLAKRRFAQKKFSPGASPIISIGHGLVFHQAKTNYREGLLPDDLARQVMDDKNEKQTSPSTMLVFGLGSKFYFSKSVALGLELAAKPTFSDYLDGVSRSGNEQDKDWLVAATLSVSYVFPVKMRDGDNDGVADAFDKCPDEKGFKRFSGCPEKPEAKAVKKTKRKAKKEKPEPEKLAEPAQPNPSQTIGDADGDKVPDNIDRCPDAKGHVIYQGCPDSDGDKIPDHEDQCPDLAGKADKNGCPEREEILIPQSGNPENEAEKQELNKSDLLVLQHATQNIRFKPGLPDMLPDHEVLLEEVAAVMERNADLSLIVRSYTDNTGNSAKNLLLSQKRAEKCVQYLVKLGIDKSRLKAEGRGDADPVAPNSTPEGRQKNRRVEFAVE